MAQSRVSILAVLVFGFLSVQAQQGQKHETPDQVVKALYQGVTFTPCKAADWEYVKTLFVPEAVIAIRNNRDSLSVMTVDEFILDFKTFITSADLSDVGFTERITKIKVQEFGLIAQAFVLFEAEVPGSGMEAQQGLDNFSLIKKNGVWKILAINNEVIFPGMSLPPGMIE